MYTTKTNYGGNEYEEHYQSLDDAMKEWAGWYEHGLDMCGQVSSTFSVFDDRGNCVFADKY